MRLNSTPVFPVCVVRELEIKEESGVHVCCEGVRGGWAQEASSCESTIHVLTFLRATLHHHNTCGLPSDRPLSGADEAAT